MKTILKIIVLITIFTFTSCTNDDPEDNRAIELIEVYVDGNSPINFSNNIIAKDYNLPASSGSTNIFKINSENSSSDLFEINLGMGSIAPFVATTPSSEVLSPSISHRLKIDGIHFDDTNPLNSITVNYTTFGTNTGDKIEINFSGNYYVIGSNVSHTLYVGVDIERD